MAKGREIRIGPLVEPDVDQREDLGGRRRGCLSSACPPQNAALDPPCVREDGQHEIAISKRVMIEHQRFVVDGWHDVMVAEPR